MRAFDILSSKRVAHALYLPPSAYMGTLELALSHSSLRHILSAKFPLFSNLAILVLKLEASAYKALTLFPPLEFDSPPILSSSLHSKKDRISAILYATPGFAPGSNGIPSYASFAVFSIPRH